MVLEPKFVDYGSIHPTADVPQLQQHNSSHALLSPRSVLSLPPLDDEELPNTSKGTNMTQEKALRKQKRIHNKRAAEEDLARERLFEQYSTMELPIFNLPGIKFHTFRHKKIKFSFHPATITNFVNKNVRFYVSLKYVLKHWRVKRDSIPANYKLRIYNLFYDQKFFIVDDENIFSVITKIHEILLFWAKNEETFRLEKSQKYKNGEDIEIDSDDEQLFFNQEERIQLYQKRLKILRRMIPPTNK